MPKVSVISATYNGSKALHKTIQSILNQSLKDFELIIVDDGSTDDTVEIAKSFRDDRITIIEQKNSGSPAAPRNKGVAAAKGELIAFCDQDDIWYPEKLEKQLAAYDESADKVKIGIIFSSADLIDETDKIVGKNQSRYTGFVDSEEAYRQMLMGDFIIACSAIVPKKIFLEVGGLDEDLVGVDDYDLWLRITEKYGVLAVSQTLCGWRQTSGSLSQDKMKQYLRTEGIFQKLDETDSVVKLGHGKNMLRIIQAALIAKDYKIVRQYLFKIKKYPLISKGKLLISVTNLSLSLGRILLLILKSIGRVSL